MVKKYKPVTPGSRHRVSPSFDELTVRDKEGKRIKPERSLLLSKRRTNGRNGKGHITTRHRGGGHKKHYRLVDFKRDKDDIPATVHSIQYDPNRSAYIALLYYTDGEKRYILAPKGVKSGQKIISGETAPFTVGNALSLSKMPVGAVVHNIELVPGRGGKLVRSAGLSAQLVARTRDYATIRMPSGEMRLVPSTCKATLGAVSNGEHSLIVLGKAGRMRWKGVRPTVRGTAMNPVDHPHGGGEGRHNGYIPRTPWGKQTKGMKTRSRKKSTKLIVKDRRKK